MKINKRYYESEKLYINKKTIAQNVQLPDVSRGISSFEFSCIHGWCMYGAKINSNEIILRKGRTIARISKLSTVILTPVAPLSVLWRRRVSVRSQDNSIYML